MDVLDGLCQRTKLCQARAGPDFPYLKGGIRICCCFLKDKGTTYHYLDCLWESGRKKQLSSLLSKLNITLKECYMQCGVLKSNEDMILALAGQFKQLSHEPEKFR